eukprot:CAMPEP_0196770862 /NCGR_PEP_ID=MMETSP1104-20130614/1378_1 /TAXON_ID=33652 /ORGANISM="Cafeteria sp., Strain Caron Lab Isolate" /LENGTH=247 /DNA_ID=CAMNT_0042140977 /DNA_START=153 /DNA_END=895 /DNA_ORIENTATION=+
MPSPSLAAPTAAGPGASMKWCAMGGVRRTLARRSSGAPPTPLAARLRPGPRWPMLQRSLPEALTPPHRRVRLAAAAGVADTHRRDGGLQVGRAEALAPPEPGATPAPAPTPTPAPASQTRGHAAAGPETAELGPQAPSIGALGGTLAIAAILGAGDPGGGPGGAASAAVDTAVAGEAPPAAPLFDSIAVAADTSAWICATLRRAVRGLPGPPRPMAPLPRPGPRGTLALAPTPAPAPAPAPGLPKVD